MGQFRDIRQLLTAKEVAQLFGYSQSTITKSFKRVAASIKKKYNVSLFECKGDDEKKYYQIYEDTSNRAVTIYNQSDDLDIPITIESLGFEAYQLFVFLVLSASPQGVFRGTRKDLLKYVGIEPTKKAVETLDDVIKTLVDKDYICFHEDEEFIIIYLKAKIQKEYLINIKMLRTCQQIAKENHKNFNKIGQLLRVWKAMIVLIQKGNNPFTYQDLKKITHLSYSQIRDVRKLLQQGQYILLERSGPYQFCKGNDGTVNAYYQPKSQIQELLRNMRRPRLDAPLDL